ncbi:MAG: hypothetical protein ACK5W1_05370 [Flavobacteriales bacterium]
MKAHAVIKVSIALILVSWCDVSAQVDTSFTRSLVQLNDTRISGGSTWGGATFINGELYESPFYFLDGNGSMSVAGLPFLFQFNYSDIGFRGGPANRLILQLDIAKLRKLRSKEIPDKSAVIDRSIDSLEKVRVGIGRSMVYALWRPEVPNRPDTLSGDSLNPAFPDSLHMPNLSYESPNPWAHIPLDSLRIMYNETSEALAHMKEQRRKMEELSSPDFPRENPLGRLFKGQQLSQLKVGNSAPSFSPLTLENTRLMGLVISTESNRIHADGAAGWIVRQNPGLISPADINPISNWRRQLLTREGFVTYGRVGIGRLNGNHLYAALCSGNDQVSPLFSIDGETRRATNLEVEGQLKSDKHTLLIRGAQMVGSNNRPNVEDTNAPMPKPLEVSAFNLLYSGNYEKVKLKSELEGQWTGPQYYTVGNPFLRSDNAILKTRVSNSSLRWFQPALIAGHSFNDVLDNTPFGSTITYGGLEVTSHPISRLVVKCSWAPSVIHTGTETTSNRSRSNIYSGTVMYHSSGKKWSNTYIAAYNQMIQIWDTLLIEGVTLSGSVQLLYDQKYQIEAQLQAMEYVTQGSATQEMVLTGVSIGAPVTKKATLRGGATILNEKVHTSLGYSFSMQAQLSAKWSASVSYEQFPEFNETAIINSRALSMPFMTQIRMTYAV